MTALGKRLQTARELGHPLSEPRDRLMYASPAHQSDSG